MLINFISGTHLETKIVLASAHKRIHIVALDVETILAKHAGNAANGTFERAETIIKFTGTTASWHREVELIAPIPFIICCLY